MSRIRRSSGFPRKIELVAAMSYMDPTTAFACWWLWVIMIR